MKFMSCSILGLSYFTLKGHKKAQSLTFEISRLLSEVFPVDELVDKPGKSDNCTLLLPLSPSNNKNIFTLCLAIFEQYARM